MGPQYKERVAESIGIGYSFVQDLDSAIQRTLDEARGRSPVEWGKPEYYDALKLNIPLENEIVPLDSEKEPPVRIMQKALQIRNVVEWAGWTQATAFPPLRELAAPGEPLGQCLVTARFGLDYFQNARLAEVKVKQRKSLVGPHIIIILPSQKYGDIALDLTPDQALAMGTIPQAVRHINPHLKVNIIPLLHPKNPYQIVNYQSDRDLSSKTSKPLEHTRLLKELVAFSLGHAEASRLEKYAKRIPISEIARIAFPEIPNLIKLLQQKNDATFQIQAGIIEGQELEPDPTWLWETSGLAGYRTAKIYNRGFIQEILFFQDNRIYILNLVGNPPVEVLEKLEHILQTPQTRVLPGKPLLKDHIELREWTGPIFVDPKI